MAPWHVCCAKAGDAGSDSVGHGRARGATTLPVNHIRSPAYSPKGTKFTQPSNACRPREHESKNLHIFEPGTQPPQSVHVGLEIKPVTHIATLRSGTSTPQTHQHQAWTEALVVAAPALLLANAHQGVKHTAVGRRGRPPWHLTLGQAGGRSRAGTRRTTGGLRCRARRGSA